MVQAQILEVKTACDSFLSWLLHKKTITSVISYAQLRRFRIFGKFLEFSTCNFLDEGKVKNKPPPTKTIQTTVKNNNNNNNNNN